MTERYENPLCTRYASNEMQFIFSEENKFTTWRKLWVVLAESQKELGLDISDEQLIVMQKHVSDINYDVAYKNESAIRHDVMAHILAYGEQCPGAKPIIHLGATSSYIVDNTDIILQKSSLMLIKRLLINTIAKIYDFAERYKALPTLAYTHYQPAQPTTVGKRATLWLQDLLFDLDQLDFILNNMKLLGCKGATGTGASFLSLFDGDHIKVLELEKKIAQKLGFEKVYSISSQIYSRKVDYYILSVLSGIAQSAYKFSNDIRLLSHLKEFDEPFEDKQIGSSAMAYKRNPVRSERIASLARYVMVNALNPALTASSQWFERTLDDSANRRISIPESFLAVDAILSLFFNVINGITVYPLMIAQHLDNELPFIATENILMYCVKNGGNRQELHERIRFHSMEATRQIKTLGAENDLINRILADTSFNLTEKEMNDIISYEKFTGMAKEQTEEFLIDVKRILELNNNLLGADISISV